MTRFNATSRIVLALVSCFGLAVSASEASATIFKYSESGPVIGTSSSYNDQNQNFSYQYDINKSITASRSSSNSFWLVVSDGPDPSMNKASTVVLMGDLKTGTVTALAYRKSDPVLEYMENQSRDIPDAYQVAKFNNAISVNETDSKQSVSFDIDATAINNANLNDEWKGLLFGDKAGYWLRVAENGSFNYDADGNLTKWGTGNFLKTKDDVTLVKTTCTRRVVDGEEKVQDGTTTEEVCTPSTTVKKTCKNEWQSYQAPERYSCGGHSSCRVEQRPHGGRENRCEWIHRYCTRMVLRGRWVEKCTDENQEVNNCKLVEKPKYKYVTKYKTETYGCTKAVDGEGELITAGNNNVSTHSDGTGTGVPEPAPMMLLALAGLALAVRKRADSADKA